MMSRIQLITVAGASLMAFFLLAACGIERESASAGVRRVDVAEFASLMNEGQPVILDVRTPEEFAAGHIPGAINLNVNSPGFTQEIRNLKTNQVYLVYCRSGRRSRRACSLMRQAGFVQLDELASGFKSWQAAGKPVEP